MKLESKNVQFKSDLLIDKMPTKYNPVERIKVKMISLALKLAEESVPVLVLFQHAGKVKTYGSKNILEVVQDILLEDNNIIGTAVEKDASNLVDNENCDDPMVAYEKVIDENVHPTGNQRRAEFLFKNSGLAPVLEPLPYPLTIMTFQETIRTLRNNIVHDKVSRSGVGGEVKYGHPDWEPSFWPNHLWKWTDLKRNLKNLTQRDFPGSTEMSLLDFYKLCIKESLELQGQDPETFFSAERTVEEISYRRKSRACRSANRNSLLMEERKDALNINETIAMNILGENDVDDPDGTEQKFNIEEVCVKNIELEEYSNVVPLDNADNTPNLTEKRKHVDTLDDHPPPNTRRRSVRGSVICYKV